ncbi:MAG: hypothetical protein ABI091_17780 [Ferruginibacter sp.]
MIILFDAYMQYPNLKYVVKKDIELYNFFFEITKFVMERLKPLGEKIDLEEAEEINKENKSKATIIWVLPENQNQVTFVGYSDTLREKMLSCFSKKDFDFFINKSSEFIKIRNN